MRCKSKGLIFQGLGAPDHAGALLLAVLGGDVSAGGGEQVGHDALGCFLGYWFRCQ